MNTPPLQEELVFSVGQKLFVHNWRGDYGDVSDAIEELPITKVSRTHWTVERYFRAYRVPKLRGDRDEMYTRLVMADDRRVRFWLLRERLEAHVASDMWMAKHQHKLIEAIQRCDDVRTLRAIAVIVGYEAK